jgi:hypothetical protein
VEALARRWSARLLNQSLEFVAGHATSSEFLNKAGDEEGRGRSPPTRGRRGGAWGAAGNGAA